MTAHSGNEYSSTLSLTSAVDGFGWSAPRRKTLYLQKQTLYSLYRTLCEPLHWSTQVRKISFTPGFDPRTVNPLTISYID